MFHLKQLIAAAVCLCLLAAAAFLCYTTLSSPAAADPEPESVQQEGAAGQDEQNESPDTAQQPPEDKKDFIKWVDFNITAEAMSQAMKYDIDSHGSDRPISWIDLLAYLATRYGNDFKQYKSADMAALVEKLNAGQSMEDLTKDMKYFPYYQEAFTAVLGGMLGDYKVEYIPDENSGQKAWKTVYGLKAFSPIARGYDFGHYDDFGNKRSYGFARKHLGNDLMGNIGTPIIAVESGIVEALGWNQYGGWRIGIRSLDNKRYYYYAHLRKDRPYHADLQEGSMVQAGDVIGYLGMTGYSTKENVNNINVPHLHFGIQLIFDESQKEGNNEIWIDCYEIVNFLQKNKSTVYKVPETKEYYRQFGFAELGTAGQSPQEE